MATEAEIRENLTDAGCSPDETDSIMHCICTEDRKNAEKLIRLCRKKQLDKVHEGQKCIDRLDYLIWQMHRQ